LYRCGVTSDASPLQEGVTAVEAPPSEPAVALDWDALAKELDEKSPLEIMDHVRVVSLSC